MTAVMSTIRTSVNVNIQTRSVVWVSNELLRLLQEWTVARGLPLDRLNAGLDLFSSSFRTWLTGRWLQGVALEVYDHSTDKLVEKCAWDLSYEAGPKAKEVFETHIDKLKIALAKLKKVRPGCRYRVVVTLKEKAPPLEGWQATNFRDDAHLSRTEVGNMINTAAINATMALWIERTDDLCTE